VPQFSVYGAAHAIDFTALLAFLSTHQRGLQHDPRLV
jgi:hypothetical protein